TRRSRWAATRERDVRMPTLPPVTTVPLTESRTAPNWPESGQTRKNRAATMHVRASRLLKECGKGISLEFGGTGENDGGASSSGQAVASGNPGIPGGDVDRRFRPVVGRVALRSQRANGEFQDGAA